MSPDATPERPLYRKLREEGGATSTFMITCDEGWRTSIVCTGMYEWAADWLLTVLGHQPYAPSSRS